MKSAKVRVYEFARQVNLSSKELLEILHKGGFILKSHMAVLDQEAQRFLSQKFKKVFAQGSAGKKQAKDMVSTQTTKKVQSTQKLEQPKLREVLEKKKHASKKLTASTVSEEVSVLEPVVRELSIEAMTPGDFAKKIGEPATDVILTLLKWGIVCPKNQMLPEDVIVRLAQHYEASAIKKSAKAEKEIFASAEAEKISKAAVRKEKLEARLPIIVVMGHVDHGKTTLLDFIRKTRVVAKEKGGITQHLGAYEVETPHGGIVFLDTPGHEAFIRIRMRGAKVADIAVLVIAADDGVMPQTIEAIRHAKAMGLPIVVAINKIDKVEQHQIEAVKRDLAQHDLLPEDWGGQIVCVPISAKLGQGVEHLLEMISLQAQVMDLEADRTIPASGYILESTLEKGRGPVATLICQHGEIKKGDFFVCGETVGRVNSLIDSYGRHVSSAGPSVPVRVAGFSSLPEAGDFLQVVSQRDYKKARSTKAAQRVAHSKISAAKGDINIIVKTDTNSSREALLGSILRLSKKLERPFHIVHDAVGNISEGDVGLAATTGSMIVGLHVKAEPNGASLARRSGVEIRLFDIIYKLIEDLEEFSERKKEIKKVKKKIGDAIVLRVFDIKNVGVIAGCVVKNGRCSRDGSLVIWRGNIKIGEGKIKSLQREKKTVKEVHSGFECGFLVEGFDNWQVDDRVDCYLEMLPDEGK